MSFAVEDLAVDRQLADISESFRFLLDVTPVNVDDARGRFLDSTDEEAPAFEYRPLEDDPQVLAAELAAVDVEAVRDPTLAHLAQRKRRELDLQLQLLAARDTPEVRPLGIELYGTVGPSLLAHATAILDQVAPSAGTGAHLDAVDFVALAEAELDHYRATDPDLPAHVELRPDASGLMVSGGVLLVAPTARVSVDRAAAVLHHEIGTHVLTYVNGSRQPLRMLAAGLAGCEETQEGLAMLAEHLGGGLTASRLRQVAARVVAVHGMVEGRSFRSVHDEIAAVGFSPPAAFMIVMRAFRAGGLTKDLVYLRGLVELLAHLQAGHDLDVLFLGKLSLDDAPLVEQLWNGGALVDPLLRPRYLADDAALDRLERLRSSGSVLDLVEGAKPDEGPPMRVDH